MTVKQWFKHAFAVDPPGPAEPTGPQRAAVDWVCTQVARRRLTTPGLIFLEMWRPMNWLSAQMMHVAEPAVWALAAPRTHDGYTQFSEFLERRGSMEYLVSRVEYFEQQFTEIEKAGGSVRSYIRRHFENLREREPQQKHEARDSSDT